MWEELAGVAYKPDKGEALYRRSLYTFWKRSAPPASMEIFGAPNRETCTVRRERTNTPLQALVTLNDVQHIEAARHLAQTILLVEFKTDAEDGGTGFQLDDIGKSLLSRPFRAEEQIVLKKSLAELLAYYKAHPDDAKQLITFGESKPDASLDPATLAAWTMLTNEVMNFDEVLTK